MKFASTSRRISMNCDRYFSDVETKPMQNSCARLSAMVRIPRIDLPGLGVDVVVHVRSGPRHRDRLVMHRADREVHVALVTDPTRLLAEPGVLAVLERADLDRFLANLSGDQVR